jgi:hypothetical protein
MNNRQIAKRNMYQSVYDMCLKYQHIYGHIPAFVDTVKDLRIIIDVIDKEILQQTNVTSKGVSLTKMNWKSK